MSSLPTKDAEGMNLGLTANKPGKEGWGGAGGGGVLDSTTLDAKEVRFVAVSF